MDQIMEYATIWKQHGKQVMRYRIEYRDTFDLSQQSTPTRVEYVSGKVEAKRMVKASGALLWN